MARQDADQLDKQISALVDALTRRSLRRRPGDEPIRVTAIVIARWLGVDPEAKHETKRRRVRSLVKAAREAGHAIASDGKGYWLATTAADHEAHQEHKRKMGANGDSAAIT